MSAVGDARPDSEELYQLLKEVQLEQFFDAICSIDVTRIEHFVNVFVDDLTDPKVGMGAPAARRLISAAKNKIKERKRKSILNMILPSKSGTLSNHNKQSVHNSAPRSSINSASSHGLTCLIQSKDIKTSIKLGDGSFGVSPTIAFAMPSRVNRFGYHNDSPAPPLNHC